MIRFDEGREREKGGCGRRKRKSGEASDLVVGKSLRQALHLLSNRAFFAPARKSQHGALALAFAKAPRLHKSEKFSKAAIARKCKEEGFVDQSHW